MLVIPMNCPIEKTELIDHTETGVAFHFCRECHGMFFSKAQLLGCLKTDKVSVEVLGQPNIFYDVTQKIIRRCCPSCESPTMLNKILDDIAIDVCEECKGVWLDAGELDKILGRHQQKKPKGGEAAKKSESELWDADGAGDAVSTFFEGSGDWLEDIGSSLGEFFTIDF